MTPPLKLALSVAAGAALSAFLLVGLATHPVHVAAAAPASTIGQAEKPALAVTLTRLQPAKWLIRLTASGNVMPWQEALVGAESEGLRLIDVKVDVGDRVRRGQVLAEFAADTVRSDLAERRALVAEAQSALEEARNNAQRARELQGSGALSTQQIQQYAAAEQGAQARLLAAQAQLEGQALRLRQTRLVAPDDGIISARSATLGAVVPAGQELFRLIRRGRLEWRAEVAAHQLDSLRPGQRARVVLPGGQEIAGILRVVAPQIDVTTRNALVYVDLPQPGNARAGLYASGSLELGSSTARTLPQGAVLMRDGLHHVMRVGADARVQQTLVRIGRQQGDRVEVLDGLSDSDAVVSAGAAFLADGDLVRVVQATLPMPATPSTAATPATPSTR